MALEHTYNVFHLCAAVHNSFPEILVVSVFNLGHCNFDVTYILK